MMMLKVDPPQWLLDNLASATGVVVAVSGGPDSMYLALYLKAALAPLNIPLQAVHVDHKLRPESRDEADQVVRWLAEYDIPTTVLTWEHQPLNARIQEQAREARYRLLLDYCYKHNMNRLCTAHHAGDQRETFFMRLKKMSGLKGLCGIQKITPLDNIQLVRPLLNHSKKLMVDELEKQGIPYLIDASNISDKYERNRIRHFLSDKANDPFLPNEEELNYLLNKLTTAKMALDQGTNVVEKLFITFREHYAVIDTRFIEQPQYFQEEILRKMVNRYGTPRKYPLRQKSVDVALLKLQGSAAFTLGGCYFKLASQGWEVRKEHA